VEILVARAWAQAALAAGARAGSMADPKGLACERALQHCQPDRVDEGDGGGGVLGLRRWRFLASVS
jgi:hypothetical protein